MKKLFFAVCLFTAISLQAQTDALRSKHFNINNDGVAIEGYDCVSYFDAKPLEGKKEYAYNYKGVTYWFASQRNLDRFKATPDKYEPQYGGWCAYAMGAKGEKVEIDPETYKIFNAKLYLFYNFFFSNTLEDWNENEPDLQRSADTYWQKTLK